MGAKDRNKDYVLIKVKEIFLKDGIIGVSMADIAEQVGFGVASLYRYFGNRESLIIECAVSLWRDRFLKIKNTFDKNIDCTGYDLFMLLTKDFSWLIIDDKEFNRVLNAIDVLFANNAITLDDRKKYDDIMMDIFGLYNSAYNKGVEDGTIRVIDNFELFFFTAVQTLLSFSQKMAYRGNVMSDDKTFDDKITMLINIFTNYVKE